MIAYFRMSYINILLQNKNKKKKAFEGWEDIEEYEWLLPHERC